MQFHNFASINEAWGKEMLPAPSARAQKRNRGTKKCKPQPMQTPQYMPAVTNAQDPWCDLYTDGYSHQQVDKIMDMYSPGDESAQDARYAPDVDDVDDDDDDERVEERFSDESNASVVERAVDAKTIIPKAATKNGTKSSQHNELFQSDPYQRDLPLQSTYIELGMYVVSGILLIIMMEQFVQIGMNIRSH